MASDTIGNRLRDLRLRLGLTQRDIAEAAGVNEAAIGRLERGSANRPHRVVLHAYAETLGTTERYLLSGDERYRYPAETQIAARVRACLALSDPAHVDAIMRLWQEYRDQEGPRQMEQSVSPSRSAFLPQEQTG